MTDIWFYLLWGAFIIFVIMVIGDQIFPGGYE